MPSYLKSIGITCLLCSVLPGAVVAQVDPPQVVARPAVIVILPTTLADDLSVRLKESLVKALPPELVFESRHNWGHQAEIPSLQGLKPIHVMRNHGDWEKAQVISSKLGKHLSLRIGELYSPDDHRAVFTIHVTTPATVELHSQTWQNGVQVFTSSMRARFHLAADLTVEAALTPAAKLQLTKATFSSRGFVAENINGLGGDFARLSSDKAQRSFKPWQPTILAEFQKSMIAALRVAGETDEVRASWARMMRNTAAARRVEVRAQEAAVKDIPAPGPVVVAQGMLVPCFAAPLWIEIPIAFRTPTPPLRLPPPGQTPLHERWGLSEFSIEHNHSGSAHSGSSGSASHSAPEHKK